MSKEFWNSRYSNEQYSYGTEPNQFFKSYLDNLKPGKALFLGEGEGRNSVYAAKLKWNVDAVDFSDSAKDKAINLANNNNVKINYTVCDLSEYNFAEENYDLVVMIFLHLPSELAKRIFTEAIKSLKRNGLLLVEAFHKNQIKNNSGGPKNIDLLVDENDFINLTSGLEQVLLETKVINLFEGEHHSGIADVVRFIGKKV